MTDLDLKPVKVTPYLTIISGRTPKQKTHTTLGNAKNAFDTPRYNPNVNGYAGRRGMHTHGWGGLYEFTGTEWKLLYEVRQPEQSDEIVVKYGPQYETRPWKVIDD